MSANPNSGGQKVFDDIAKRFDEASKRKHRDLTHFGWEWDGARHMHTAISRHARHILWEYEQAARQIETIDGQHADAYRAEAEALLLVFRELGLFLEDEAEWEYPGE